MVKGATTVVLTVIFRMGKDMKTIIGSCNPEWDDMKTWLFSIYKTGKGYKIIKGKVNKHPCLTY